MWASLSRVRLCLRRSPPPMAPGAPRQPRSKVARGHQGMLACAPEGSMAVRCGAPHAARHDAAVWLVQRHDGHLTQQHTVCTCTECQLALQDASVPQHSCSTCIVLSVTYHSMPPVYIGQACKVASSDMSLTILYIYMVSYHHPYHHLYMTVYLLVSSMQYDIQRFLYGLTCMADDSNSYRPCEFICFSDAMTLQTAHPLNVRCSATNFEMYVMHSITLQLLNKLRGCCRKKENKEKSTPFVDHNRIPQTWTRSCPKACYMCFCYTSWALDAT